MAIDVADGEAWDAGGTSDTTNNRMEMQAWIEGLDALHDAFGSVVVLVYSDSEYVGLGAMDRSRRRKKNQDLWVEIDRVVDQHEYVEFIHVKGHAGHAYNERVDTLASEARKAANAAIERVSRPLTEEERERALVTVGLVAEQLDEFTTDDVPFDFATNVDPRAAGYVMREAAKAGFIDSTDRFRVSAEVTCHGRPKQVWASRLR